jgi:uncharacterized MnhB-related membrane protein
MILILLDGILSSGLILLAFLIITQRSSLKSVISFFSFGLLMSISWVRLMAPDVALAEAAIGAGLTGILLLSAAAAPRGNGTNE